MYWLSRSMLTKLPASSASILVLTMFAASASEDLKVSESDFQPEALPELSEFELSVDAELADFILERDAELADVQTRGVTENRSRSRILKSGTVNTNVSVSAFRQQTRASGLQVAASHVKAVSQGAQADPKLVAKTILDAKKANPDRDIMAMLFMVFRESIQEQNEDKRYWIMKLQGYNAIAEALSDYLKQLNDAAATLADSDSDSGSGSGCDEDSGPDDVDTSVLDPDHRVLADRILEERAWVNGPEGIAITIERLETMQRDVWKRRRNASTKFQNFDQKANQLYNLLSSVMKAMKEMQAGTQRNLL